MRNDGHIHSMRIDLDRSNDAIGNVLDWFNKFEICTNGRNICNNRKPAKKMINAFFHIGSCVCASFRYLKALLPRFLCTRASVFFQIDFFSLFAVPIRGRGDIDV